MLKNKYKNYKFKIEEASDNQAIEAYQAIKIYNKKFDDEILLLSLHGGGSFSLYLQDRFFNLNIDDGTKKVLSFEGELTNKMIKILKLKLPTIVKNAILTLNTNDKLEQGTGCYIEFNTRNVVYDRDQKILQIGEINSEEITYKFFNNAYTQIKDGELSGLMFTDIEL